MKILTYILSAIICIVVLFLAAYSVGEAIDVLPKILIALILIALLLTLCLTLFFKGDFGLRLLKVIPISIILTGMAYILGYFFQTFLILQV